MSLELPGYLLLPSGYEDLGQDVQLRVSFQLLRFIALWLGVAALSALPKILTATRIAHWWGIAAGWPEYVADYFVAAYRCHFGLPSQVSSLKTWARASSCVYPSNYCVLLRNGLGLLRHLLLSSGSHCQRPLHFLSRSHRGPASEASATPANPFSTESNLWRSRWLSPYRFPKYLNPFLVDPFR